MTTEAPPRRRGRQRLHVPRAISFSILLSETERDELDRRAIESNCTSAADFIRRKIISGEPRTAAYERSNVMVHEDKASVTTYGAVSLKPNIVHAASEASRKTGVPLAILLSQLAEESGGDPHAVSPDGEPRGEE